VVTPKSTIIHQKSDMIEPLSERELEVLKLLRSDLSGPEIAGHLVISPNTFRTHTKNIFSKLGVNNRRAAVRRAEELDLI
jgi:LuxR family maltose regulon positive regulatory protein